MRRSLRSIVALTIFITFFVPFGFSDANAAANVTATGTNPSICDQTVSNTSGVTSTRISGGDCVIKFTSASTSIDWTVPTNAQTIRLLVLGGGGAGGVDAGPGGSGGGAYEASNVAVIPGATVSTYVASGGTAGIYNGTSASTGETSTTTVGSSTFRGTGGSVGPYGISTSPQPAASNGGIGSGVGGTATSGALGGGGKGWINGVTGAGSAGNDGNLVTDISGSSTRYGGGGAGGANVNGVSVSIVNGGAGGGGAAGYNSPSNTIAASGIANSGGGGGAGMSNVSPANFKSSGAGGSGLIIIRYTPDTTGPIITNASSPFLFAENTPVSTIAATIEISESSTISMASSGDYLKFNITVVDTDTARIYFVSSPDFENRADINADNDYALTINLRDLSGNSSSASLTIRVTNVNEQASIGTISLSGALYKGTSKSITITVSTPSKVQFLVNGKRIAKCLAIATTGTYPNYSASCDWIPTVMSRQILTAVATPTDGALSPVSSAGTTVTVIKRTTTR